MVYSREVEGSIYTSGISGRLYKSNVLLYDHQKESLWSQLMEKAITGPLAGTPFKPLPSIRSSWKAWRKKWPNTVVLSTDTGYGRDYSVDPYEGYYRSLGIWFPVGEVRKDLSPKEMVLGTVEDEVGGESIEITVAPDGEVSSVRDPEGNGGTIITHEGVACAFREEFSPSPRSAHRLFLRHTIVKKLEDYFHRQGLYMFAHIPRPLGSVSRDGEHPSEAYIYEWAFGTEGFPWDYFDRNGNGTPIRLHDWDKFVMNFHLAGIDVQMDTSDPDDGRISKNIIHQYSKPIGDGTEMSSLWKRIDFGYESMRIDSEKLSRFLHDNRKRLTKALRTERYEMISLANEYLTHGKQMGEVDIGRLDSLVGEYRRSSLRHHVSRGVGIGEPDKVYVLGRTEFLI